MPSSRRQPVREKGGKRNRRNGGNHSHPTEKSGVCVERRPRAKGKPGPGAVTLIRCRIPLLLMCLPSTARRWMVPICFARLRCPFSFSPPLCPFPHTASPARPDPQDNILHTGGGSRPDFFPVAGGGVQLHPLGPHNRLQLSHPLMPRWQRTARQRRGVLRVAYRRGGGGEKGSTRL